MKRVLLIEGDDLIGDLLGGRLQREEYIVHRAKNRKRGIQLMREQAAQLVIVDMDLPHDEGLRILQEMHDDEKLQRIPAIAISNSGDPQEVQQGKEFGVADWIIKTSFNLEEAVEKIGIHCKEDI